MKVNLKNLALLILCFPLISTLGCTQSTEEEKEKVYTLVWSDEFDKDGTVDPDKWVHEVNGDGGGNNEAQYYTDDKLNSYVEGGALNITAWNVGFGNKAYTSARLITKGKVFLKYGKFEIRAKLPKGKGTWPAIWMLGDNINDPGSSWPKCGEIDIMEHVGYDPGNIHASIHTEKYNYMQSAENQRTTTKYISDATTAFHVYGLEWTADSIKISIDEKTYFTYANEKAGVTSWPFDQGCFLILNLAIGGNWGGAQGIDPTIFPASMVVDYVRVYQKK